VLASSPKNSHDYQKNKRYFTSEMEQNYTIRDPENYQQGAMPTATGDLNGVRFMSYSTIN
jgi:hypothetical protein